MNIYEYNSKSIFYQISEKDSDWLHHGTRMNIGTGIVIVSNSTPAPSPLPTQLRDAWTTQGLPCLHSHYKRTFHQPLRTNNLPNDRSRSSIIARSCPRRIAAHETLWEGRWFERRAVTQHAAPTRVPRCTCCH